MAKVEYRGTGRRKKSIARVRLVPGEGNVTINNRDMREYLPFESLILDLNQPFAVTETEGNYDVLVNVHGGGSVSYTHLTLPTTRLVCRSRWSPCH